MRHRFRDPTLFCLLRHRRYFGFAFGGKNAKVKRSRSGPRAFTCRPHLFIMWTNSFFFLLLFWQMRMRRTKCKACMCELKQTIVNFLRTTKTATVDNLIVRACVCMCQHSAQHLYYNLSYQTFSLSLFFCPQVQRIIRLEELISSYQINFVIYCFQSCTVFSPMLVLLKLQ